MGACFSTAQKGGGEAGQQEKQQQPDSETAKAPSTEGKPLEVVSDGAAGKQDGATDGVKIGQLANGAVGHQQAEEGLHPNAAATQQKAQAGVGEQGAQPLSSSIPAISGVQSSPFAALSGAQAAGPPVATPQLDGAQAAAPEGTPRVNGHTQAAEAPPVTEFEEGTSYQGAPVQTGAAERVRVHALQRLGLDFTSQEASLDFITTLVTNVVNVPGAAIILIDTSRCYVKSAVGPHIQAQSRASSVDRRLSMATWTLVPLNPEILVVEDTTKDGRFRDHPQVCGPPYIRFYAAAPLMDASGQRVGALSVVDYKPRKIDAESCNVLCNFAEMVMREIQRLSESGFQRTISLNPTPENERLLRSIDACSDGVVLLDVRLARWPVLFSNEGWSQVTGLLPVSGSLKCFWDMFQLPGVSTSRHPWEVYDEAVERGDSFQLDVILAGSSGKHLFPVAFKPATEALDAGMVSIKVPAQPNATLAPSKKARLFYFGTIFRAPKVDSTPASTLSSMRQKSNSLSSEEEENLPPIPGVKLGPLLGKGSFGSVHYGTWNGAQIAVKVIQHMATEAEKRARDDQLEAILGLKMLHPNIVRTFQFATKERSGSRQSTIAERLRMELRNGMNGMGSDSSPSTPSGQRRMMETWIVLELCNRGSLQEAIDKGAFRTKGTIYEGAPNMLNVLRTAIEIAGAMSYLHSLDILHSDLNGNNILLISNTGIDDRPFSVKVSDFGLSRIHIGERTVATQTYGTVTHMPPELLAEGRLSKAADVYAFGVLLWEMFTGQRPWAGLRHVQIITHKMRNGSQLKWPPNVFPAFKELAQKCMNPDPHHRPTFAEVLDILEPIRDMVERGELERAESFPVYDNSDDLRGKSVSTMLGTVDRIVEEEQKDAREEAGSQRLTAGQAVRSV